MDSKMKTVYVTENTFLSSKPPSVVPLQVYVVRGEYLLRDDLNRESAWRAEVRLSHDTPEEAADGWRARVERERDEVKRKLDELEKQLKEGILLPDGTRA